MSMMAPAWCRKTSAHRSPAFYRCSNLTSINLPEGLQGIGDRAFDGCSNLTNIVLPESLQHIGESV